MDTQTEERTTDVGATNSIPTPQFTCTTTATGAYQVRQGPVLLEITRVGAEGFTGRLVVGRKRRLVIEREGPGRYQSSTDGATQADLDAANALVRWVMDTHPIRGGGETLKSEAWSFACGAWAQMDKVRV